MSLFGGSTNATNNVTNTTSLFGNNNLNNTSNSSAINAATNNTIAAPGATTSMSLFGGSNSNIHQGPSNEQTFRNSVSLHPSTQFQSGLGAANSTMPNASVSAAQQDLARSRLQQLGLDTRTSQKPIHEQATTLIAKWDPQSQDTLMQAYLYNAVNAAYAPFYHRNPDEDERSWEAALAEKPKMSEDLEGQQMSYIPVLVRGFRALGDRVEYQAHVVEEMRARLHEMNNSLSAVMAAHQQRILVQLESARRQHAGLGERTRRLAVKLQVLRNRGFSLDTQEEALRKVLGALEKQVMDQTFTGREEEIWARMVALRERARWLEAEGKRLGDLEPGQTDSGPTVPDEVLRRTKKILSDYEEQLGYLGKELKDVKREFGEWEDSQKGRGGRR